MNQTASTITPACFKFKGAGYTLTSLQLLDNDLSNFAAHIAEQVSKAPKFFDRTPVVIDCQIIADKPGPLDLDLILSTLRQFNIIPIGLRGGRKEHQQQAQMADLAHFQTNTSDSNATAPTSRAKAMMNANNHAQFVAEPQTMCIKQPVRSGQQIYAKGKNLVIMGSVSAGAEILADGDIHVYGCLRGRALAGCKGNQESHIFCQQLEAELVSIAGQYQLSETLKEGLWQTAAHIFVKDDQLTVEKMS